MKRTTRKLMSLLLTLALICSMAPAAMAYSGTLDNSFWGSILGWNWYCPSTQTGQHNMTYRYADQTYHQVYCASCGYVAGVEAHTSTCGCYFNNSYIGHDHRYTYVSSGYHYVQCVSHASCHYYSAKLEAHSHTYHCVYCSYNNSGSTATGNIVWDSNPICYGNLATYTHTPVLQSSYSGYNYYSCMYCSDTGYAFSNAGIGVGPLYISGDTTQISVNGTPAILSVYSTDAALNAALSSGQATVTWYSSNSSVAQVFQYTQSSGTYVYGTAVGTATIYAQLIYGGQTYTASYDITVGGVTDASVNYSLTVGKSLVLDAKSFQEFWTEVSNGYGSLNYVVFGSASGNVGQLTCKRNNITSATAVGSNFFYVNPVANQYSIADVTFTPSAFTTTGYRTGTLTVPFTAYGTNGYYSAGTASYSGNLYIMVTNGEVADIEYKSTGSALSLVPADFVSVYKTALSSTVAAPSVYIRFLDVPVNGSLYYNYNPYYSYSSGTKLTASNIGSMRFDSNAVATYGIDDVTYVPGNGNMGDTVTYMAYSSAVGGTPLYTGEIVFGAGTVPTVNYYAHINKTVKFAAADFYDQSELKYMDYISFGTPSSGVLYKDYNGSTGTRVTSSNNFVTSSVGTSTNPSVNTLTYVPAANFTGVVEIPFTGSSIWGGKVSGTVKIYVAKAFNDLAGYSWASDYITRLAAEGIVNGVTATTYKPGNELKYGEALKLIMEATGTSATVITDGSAHWAKNYLTKAYAKGLVTTTSIDLNSKITREQVAELAAKALGLSKATSVTGTVKPTDSVNGYVYALYNAGILNGTTVNGKNYYYGSNTINRAEIAKIICLVSDYYAANK